MDFTKPVQVELNGATTSHTFTPSLKTLAETIMSRADPDLAFTASFAVKKDEATGRMKVETK